MARSSSPTLPSRCLSCGFEAAPGSGEWDSVDSPPLGTMTQCPDCGSTNVMNRE
ncbi:hypothetical protein C450_04908 [Halococcus salifodinae DSM 8989]|uniref:Small CPxCG-related zinc finger protein n=1 Tax=Halococcus salifodinae DSM 8989 TaxID=1227456 RepID=M0NA66_9EURY|nr:hypothetical protein C450_04908 [Halococcus salifodinae DSM 8989]